MSQPSILFTLESHQYYPPGYNVDKYNYSDKQKDKIIERMKKSAFVRNNFMGYISRKSATERTPEEEEKEIQELIDKNEFYGSMLDYMANRGGSTGAFDRNGDCTDENLKEKQNQLKETKSVVWTAIISFIPDYSQQYVNNKEQAAKTVRNTIDSFFEKAGLDKTNMEWVGAYHINTDNRHIHLTFWEKEPKHLDSYGRPKFSKPILNKEAINSYKYTIASYHNSKDVSALKIRDDITAPLKSYLNKEEAIDFLISLNNNLGIMNSWQYARQPIYKKMLIGEAIDKFLSTNTSEAKKAREAKNKFESELSAIQKQILNNYSEVKLEPTENALNFEQMNLDDLKSRLGNQILKAIKSFRQIDETKEHDFVEDSLNKLQANLKANPISVNLKNDEDAYFEIRKKGYIEDNEIKDFNPLKFRNGLSTDRTVFNKYGIDYVCERYTHSPNKDEEGHWLKEDNGAYLFEDKDAVSQRLEMGDYNKYTFINKNGDKAVYFLNLYETKQQPFNDIFKKLEVDDNTILNIACDLSNKGMAFNLMTKTDKKISKIIFDKQRDESFNSKIQSIKNRLNNFNKSSLDSKIRKKTLEYRAEKGFQKSVLGGLMATIIKGIVYANDDELPKKKKKLEEELEEELLKYQNKKGSREIE